MYRLALTGDFSAIHEFDGAEGSCPAGTLSAVNSAKTPGDISLFGIARTGGSGGAGTLFQLNLRSYAVTVLHAFGEDMPTPVSVVYGTDGALYGITNGSATSPRVVFRFRH